MTTYAPDATELERITADLHWLMECFREVLVEAGEAGLAAALPWQDTPTPVTPTGRTAQACSIAFQLLNQAEENAAAQTRRAQEQRHGLVAERGLWGQVLRTVLDAGLDARQIAAWLPQLRVEPVLTAHPTEAKRQTVLEHYRELYLLLVKRENQMWTPIERRGIRDDVKAVLERLWLTGDIFLEQPDVASELRTVIYYLRHVFPDALTQIDTRLRHTWAELGGDPALLAEPAALPRLSFGTWVGGDRDGHPLVTAAVTRSALQELRRAALGLLHDQLTALAIHLSLSDQLQPPLPALLARVHTLAAALGAEGARALARNPNEPWRQLINLMLARLPGEPARDSSAAQPYASPAELDADLALLGEALRDAGAHRLADSDVRPVRRSLQVFGFHLASLDIRQNSAFHDRAVTQLLEAAQVADRDFPAWDEQRRLALIEHELQTPRPFARADVPLDPEAAAVVSCYRVLAEHLDTCGPDGLGALIVSMTRSLSDLLVVYLLARETGLLTFTPDGPLCRLPVVPLFETIADLERAPAILDSFLGHPVTRRSLETARAASGAGELVQQVMVGYSDSNKDGGIGASLWSVYRVQEQLAQVGRAHGVRVRFFHGRGGTISRGAGPTGRFIRALPGAALQGDLRLTEQGETIAQKYANRITATYNLELLQAGVAGATLRHLQAPAGPHALAPVMDRLAAYSRGVYTGLLDIDGFLTFYSEATPIDVLEQSKIGSRPVRRTGRRNLADLRAIPWVFSWSQARFFLSGWYGMGSALGWLQRERPDDFEQIRAQYQTWPPLHYLVSNVATSIMTADPTQMQAYAGPVTDSGVRDRLLTMILAEYQRTVRMLELLYGGSLAEQRPRIHHLLSLRQEGLTVLHAQQVALLRAWREQRTACAPAAETLLSDLLLTVNAIASGLRTTG